MPNFKIIKKHHKHINNPFPKQPNSLPIIQGNLSYNPHALHSHHVYSIGAHFRARWSSNNGGRLSIFHCSNLDKSIWETVPGNSFVSAAVAETLVEESRGSFAVNDKKIHLVCNHQSIDDIKVVDNDVVYSVFDEKVQNFSSGFGGIDSKHAKNGAKSPVLVINGWIFSMKNQGKKVQKFDVEEKKYFNDVPPPHCSAKYVLIFYEKNSHQVGFQVKLGKPTFELHHPNPKPRLKAVFQSVGRYRRRKLGFRWLSKRTNDVKEKSLYAKCGEFNRVCMTYRSEENERFYGFGEQFSHMDFKGKRVPILVQEQGIGRGDQPISLAINLVSYRYPILTN